MKSKKWFNLSYPSLAWLDISLCATLGLAVLVVWLTQNHVFFWDTVQFAGKHSIWFYEQGPTALLLPDSMDSGHPPTFGWYLAVWQRLVGESLQITHWAMLPFVWLLLYQLVRAAQRVGKGHTGWWIALLLLADPVLLGQLVLVSPDIWLCGGFLLSVNAILDHRRDQLLAGILLLGLTSTRGMMLGLVLFPLDLYWSYLTSHRITWRNFFTVYLVDYLPGGFLGLTFLIYHYVEKGWIGYHAASPWIESFTPVDAAGFFRNVAILIWRLLDFGRLFIWLLLLWLVTRKQRLLSRYFRSPVLRWLSAAALVLLVVSSWPSLYYRDLAQHRYWLPFFMCFSLLFAHFVTLAFPSERTQRWWIGIAAAGLLSGNLWIYPPRIAQGWDSTLAHLPYYSLRAAFLKEVDRRHIVLGDVATAFPEIGPLHWRDLSGRKEGMLDKNEVNTRYLYYSTIMNDFTDAELADLRNWTVLWWQQRRGVRVMLLARK